MKPFQLTLPALALTLTACGGGPDPLAPQACQERVGNYLALIEYENGEPVSYEHQILLEFDGSNFNFPDGLNLAFESNKSFRLSVTAITGDESISDASIVAVGMGSPPIFGDFFNGEFRFFLEDQNTPFLVMDAVDDPGMEMPAETQEISKLASIEERAENMGMYIDGGATVVTTEILAPFAGWLFSSAPASLRVEFYPNTPSFDDTILASVSMPAPDTAEINAGLQTAIDAAKAEYENGKCFAR